MKRILITGADGFTGWHLGRHLRAQPQVNIAGVDIHGAPARPELWDRYLQCDIADREATARLITELQPDWIFHLAGVTAGQVGDLVRINTLAAVQLFEAVLAICPKARILIVGSAAEYGPVPETSLPISESHVCRPTEPYGITKFATSTLAISYHRRHGLQVVIARPFNIIGAGVPRFLLLGGLLERILDARRQGLTVLKVGNLSPKRDFIDVQDLVAAYVKLIEGDYSGEVFNLCSGEAIPVQSIVQMLLDLTDTHLRLEVDTTLARRAEIETIYGSFDKAHAAFGFRPTVPLERSLRAAWDHAQL